MAELRERGVETPVLPGILPVTSLSTMGRLGAMGAAAPAWMEERLRAADQRGGADAVRKEGVVLATELCSHLLESGVPGLHFYTFNTSSATREIYAALGLGPNGELLSGPSVGLATAGAFARTSPSTGRNKSRVRRRWLSKPSSAVVRPHSQTTTPRSTARKGAPAPSCERGGAPRRRGRRRPRAPRRRTVRSCGARPRSSSRAAERQARDAGDPRRPGVGDDGGRCRGIAVRVGRRRIRRASGRGQQPARRGDQDAVARVGEHSGQVDGDVGASGLVAGGGDQDGEAGPTAATSLRARIALCRITRSMCAASCAIGLRGLRVGMARRPRPRARPSASVGAAAGISAVTGSPNASSARSRIWIRRRNRPGRVMRHASNGARWPGDRSVNAAKGPEHGCQLTAVLLCPRSSDAPAAARPPTSSFAPRRGTCRRRSVPGDARERTVLPADVDRYRSERAPAGDHGTRGRHRRGPHPSETSSGRRARAGADCS